METANILKQTSEADISVEKTKLAVEKKIFQSCLRR